MKVEEAQKILIEKRPKVEDKIKKAKGKINAQLKKEIKELQEAAAVYWQGGEYYLDSPTVFNKVGQPAEVKSDYLENLVDHCRKQRGLIHFTIKDRSGKEYKY